MHYFIRSGQLILGTDPKQNRSDITVSGDHGSKWQKQCMELPTGTYAVTITGESGSMGYPLAIDDIQYNDGQCPVDGKMHQAEIKNFEICH